jgi:hypothetical protein
MGLFHPSQKARFAIVDLLERISVHMVKVSTALFHYLILTYVGWSAFLQLLKSIPKVSLHTTPTGKDQCYRKSRGYKWIDHAGVGPWGTIGELNVQTIT